MNLGRGPHDRRARAGDRACTDEVPAGEPGVGRCRHRTVPTWPVACRREVVWLSRSRLLPLVGHWDSILEMSPGRVVTRLPHRNGEAARSDTRYDQGLWIELRTEASDAGDGARVGHKLGPEQTTGLFGPGDGRFAVDLADELAQVPAPEGA
jgi:hypothetical protein